MIHQNHQEWIDACREANEEINEAKTEGWKNLLQDTMSNSDGPNMWKVIQRLNGTPDANSPNKAMSHNGRTITDIKSKANVFINHYARDSELNMSQSDHDTNWQFKKRIKVPLFDDESCAPLLMSKLQSAIKKMKGKKAAGWQYSTFISQVTWSFGPPGIIIHIQLIILNCSLPTNLAGCHYHSSIQSWEIS